MPEIDPTEVAEALREDDRADRDADLADELAKTEKLAKDLARGDE
jgi:hypothetical protein